MGTTLQVTVGGAIGTITAVARNPAIVDAAIDQDTRTITLSGKTPGATFVDITDSRGVTYALGVRVAYIAGTIAPYVSLRLTGDPASADYVRNQIVAAIVRATQPRSNAQVIVSRSDVIMNGDLAQDNTLDLDVPVLIQGNDYFDADGTTHIHVENVAAPRISPDSLMVSDYPERLTENGVLFTSALKHDAPSRFLYFHYNPPGQPDRRIVLRAQNRSDEPAIVQFIAGLGGPSPNEMEAGHDATKRFLVHVIQNEGRLITVGAHQSSNILAQDLPPGEILSELLQLRVLSGGTIRLALFAQNATDDPNAPITQTELLTSTVRHARGVYDIPEFHYAAQWDLTGPYLELPIGQIPLPNTLQGEALAGDYGVLEAFVVNVQNPLPTP
ncbi:MAG: Ig-like domain-containing protein, partial [Vulcanimicrobiaceae bacterium]